MYRTQRRIFSVLYFVAIFILLVIFLSPFLWMVYCSFKTPIELSKLPVNWLKGLTMDNYQKVFVQQNFFKFIKNSVIVAAGSTFFGLLIGLPASYSIARHGQKKLSMLILTSRIVPGITFLLPLYIMFRELKMVDTYTSLILAHMLTGLPFIVWLMTPFFESLPKELGEAAVVDGASSLRTFVSIVLPLSVPGIVTATILSFTFSWNNFMFSIVLATNRTRTVPVAIYNFISYASIDWGGLMAAATVITLPILVLAVITQRYVIRGMTAGAVKG
ncbi:MAG: carbohydrate ABC transporter permease [Chloroflexi bacterium]|nr:carbohydrate ABC transporter permease [Chloroflexota bacterium]